MKSEPLSRDCISRPNNPISMKESTCQTFLGGENYTIDLIEAIRASFYRPATGKEASNEDDDL